jgi:poly-gamma-glutamate synthase PgsB/CapB
MSEVKSDSARRILVTGSRGKSSVVRLLHAALHDAGLHTFARITGVVPRELGPKGIQTISRSSGAHVEEMRWWLRRLPESAQAIILENSAITPELQALAGRWLRPDITIFTNAVPDHQEVWGPTGASAAEVLTAGIPERSQIVLPARLKIDGYLMELLERRACTAIFAEPVADAGPDFQAINLGLALSVIKHLGLATAPALQAMSRVQQDRYDFRVVNCDGAEVAMAFSANDISSTRALFRSLMWSEEETRLIYNHRADRPGRFRSFVDWLGNSHWREVLIIGDKPRMRPGSAQYLKIKNEKEFLRLFQPGDRVFGCGNIAGLPLSLAAVLN